MSQATPAVFKIPTKSPQRLGPVVEDRVLDRAEQAKIGVALTGVRT